MPADFAPQGEVHKEVIRLWDTHYRDHFASQLDRRLFGDGDVYVLYDVQISGLQSFVEMTRRCRDTRQISELVALLNPVLAVLQPLPGTENSKGWICSGGRICTSYNFIGKEVPLCSSQFLGLLGALATNVTENIPSAKRTQKEKDFLSEAFNTMAVQVNRWLSDGYFKSVDRRFVMNADDIKDGSSRYFFSDKDLWYLTILSDLSQLQRAGISPSAEDGSVAFRELLGKKEEIGKMFNLFLKRTSLVPLAEGVRADLDQGFWRYYFDNRYAAYTGDKSPVAWEKKSEEEWEMNVQVAWDSSYIARNTGWDISHSRRLVPALETFVRNRENIRRVWGYANPAFDPVAIRRAFANQLVEKIWNGDRGYPLFANFWSGDNGWYRVAYANQTGRQFAGYPPYGLSISIPDGGYPLWGALHPDLNLLFRTIFGLVQSDDVKAQTFVARHYQRLGTTGKRAGSLSFLADLVGLPSN